MNFIGVNGNFKNLWSRETAVHALNVSFSVPKGEICLR